jgi:hypothetical protein
LVDLISSSGDRSSEPTVHDGALVLRRGYRDPRFSESDMAAAQSVTQAINNEFNQLKGFLLVPAQH